MINTTQRLTGLLLFLSTCCTHVFRMLESSAWFGMRTWFAINHGFSTAPSLHVPQSRNNYFKLLCFVSVCLSIRPSVLGEGGLAPFL